MIVAIDGPAGAGKGTLARRLASHLELAYLDTGLLYRAVGLKLVRQGEPVGDETAAAAAARGLTADDLKGAELRSETAAAAASVVASMPAVRAALLDFQRSFARHPPCGARGAVLDGRDIGTVVCPTADAKLFITASVSVRALRRLKELRERGIEAIEEEVLRDMQERDMRDMQRSVAPLEPAADAFVIDTTELDPEAVFIKALAHVNAMARRRSGE
jgi:cytidylate kinase